MKKYREEYSADPENKARAKELSARPEAKAKHSESTKKWMNSNRPYRQRYEKYRNAKRKMAAFNAYGGCKCSLCGEWDMRTLSMDHVNNDGAKHRREVGPNSLYKWLKDNEWPTGFQVLCMSCQWAKKLNKGVLPEERRNTKVRPIKTNSTEYLDKNSI